MITSHIASGVEDFQPYRVENRSLGRVQPYRVENRSLGRVQPYRVENQGINELKGLRSRLETSEAEERGHPILRFLCR
jgi:hypothetical protein